jgi:hypothetical protein
MPNLSQQRDARPMLNGARSHGRYPPWRRWCFSFLVFSDAFVCFVLGSSNKVFFKSRLSLQSSQVSSYLFPGGR